MYLEYFFPTLTLFELVPDELVDALPFLTEWMKGY